MRLFILFVTTFLLPWAIGVVFFLKDIKVFVTIAPIAAVLAYILNTIGIDLGLFYPLPVEFLKAHTVSILPNIGWYSVDSCMFIYLVVHTKMKPIILNIIITGIGTLTDFIFISTNFLAYGKGWNYIISMLMFFISFNIIYLYYLGSFRKYCGYYKSMI